ncbi:hypothetical protein GCM10010435_55910 [Winogradskya consettensis]|uniref:Tetratricopeptide repeat protein n=1 Tax=Winogradskya consettensis TaxID=113560 RepID=A0A919S9K3_9ACTN|nr:tetratricopeptide repeat protein [Actinoplanes consettensis]GIM67455.1 hypothetical protein Aco04nite_06410 [Actinoplanes consettensis]
MRDALGQAKELFDNERYDEALQLVEGHLADHPDDALAWHRRAEALLGLEREDEAVAAVDRSIALDTSNSMAYRLRAVLHQNSQRFPEMRADAERALELDASDYRAMVMVAFGAVMFGSSVDLFKPLVKRARRLAPDEPGVQWLNGLILKTWFRAAGVTFFAAALAVLGGWLLLDPSDDGVAPRLMWTLLALAAGAGAGIWAGNVEGEKPPWHSFALVVLAPVGVVLAGAAMGIATGDVKAGLITAALALVVTAVIRARWLFVQIRGYDSRLYPDGKPQRTRY